MTILEHALHGSHEETASLMSAYVDGELRGYRRWRVMRHLARCAVCRAAYESVLATLDGLRALARHEPPARPELAVQVVERIRRSEGDTQ